MPLFALANAGVNVRGLDFAVPGASTVLVGVALGLLMGKPIGVLLLSWLSVRLKLSVLPQGVSWGGMVIMGFAGGIGFTMAIFISELAYRGSELLDMAKLGVLAATAGAGVIAFVGGRLILQPPKAPIDAPDETAVESGTLWTVEGITTT
jgi:NhaA family Na+:H+ antiporter